MEHPSLIFLAIIRKERHGAVVSAQDNFRFRDVDQIIHSLFLVDPDRTTRTKRDPPAAPCPQIPRICCL